MIGTSFRKGGLLSKSVKWNLEGLASSPSTFVVALIQRTFRLTSSSRVPPLYDLGRMAWHGLSVHRIRGHLTFFRIHIIAFTLIPLLVSPIFYASNGRYHISYLDSLFLCISAMAVCGLETVDISSLTRWQQVILFLLMCIGSPIFVSWVVVLIRRQYFPAQSRDQRLPIVEKVNDFTLNEPQRRRLTRRLSDPEATLGRRAAPSSLYQRPNLPPNPSVVTSTSNWTNHPSVSHLIESIHPQSPQRPQKRAEGSTIRDPQKLRQIEELEYRSLTALLWILPCYYFGLQILGFAILAPYLSLRRWRDVLLPPQQHRPIPAVWFALFLTISALTNTGMTLVDQSMIPFQQAYPMLLCLGALILAGNTCFPIFLRFTIWATASCLPTTSRLHQTLRFLLKNPRRCFIYLFPSHQTWFLLGVVCVMMFADWFFFLVLDLRNQLSDLPLGVRCIVGFFQGVALRTAGFSVVPLALVAPAVKVLYAGMMYISAYPVAMSVRSTNIYEEQSLGSEVGLPEVSKKEYLRAAETKREAWSRYLAVHVRSQLAFDMWWLVLALFLVCIVERNNIDNMENYGWFNVFNILFELISAYGCVGISIGTPRENFALTGVFHPLSKLIVCAVILRGRHRGLPLALDRAVLLPHELEIEEIVNREDR